MKTLKLCLTAIILAALFSCSSMDTLSNAFSGPGAISNTKSTFDGSEIIEMSPQWVAGSSIKMGGRWSDKYPDDIVIVLSDSEIVGLRGFDVNINGSIDKYTASGMTQTDIKSNTYGARPSISSSSTNQIVMPLQKLVDMVSADDCRIRFQTTKGYTDVLFHQETQGLGAPTAKKSYRKFLDSIEDFKSK